VEQGVASPTRNRDTGSILLMSRDTGMCTRKAPTIPCTKSTDAACFLVQDESLLLENEEELRLTVSAPANFVLAEIAYYG